MNEEKLNGQSSLQLIEQMLNATKKEEIQGLKTHFAIWGVACLVIGLATYLTTSTLGNQLWNLLWFALFLVPMISALIIPRQKFHSVTFLEEAVSTVLNSLRFLFIALVVGIIVASLLTHVIDFSLMLPLAVLFCSFSSLQVWSMVRRKSYAATSFVWILLGAVLLSHILVVGVEPIHNLCGGILLALNFLIPALCYKNHKGSNK